MALVEHLGAIRALADGMLAKAAKRVDDTRTSTPVIATLPRSALGSWGSGSVRLGARSTRRRSSRASRRRTPRSAAELVGPAGADDRGCGDRQSRSRMRPDRHRGKRSGAITDGCVHRRPLGRRRTALRAPPGSMPPGRFECGVAMTEWSRAASGSPLRSAGRSRRLIDAETQQVFRTRHAEGAREPHDRYAADALVAAVLGATQRARTVNTTVHVVIDHSALVRGDVSDGERCEIPGVGPVAVAWVRELLGSAFVTAVIEG